MKTVGQPTKDGYMLLCNLRISQEYNTHVFYFMRSDFISAFAYWVLSQSPYEKPMMDDSLRIREALQSWECLVVSLVDKDQVQRFTYKELSAIINEKVFETMPEILALNVPRISSGFEYDARHTITDPGEENIKNPDFDFIDLGALARNVFYMMLRDNITTGDKCNDPVKESGPQS